MADIEYAKKSLFVLATGALVCVGSCSGDSNSGSLYDGICDIYTETLSQPVDVRDQWGIITKRISEEFPEFYEENFIHITKMDADQKYHTFKRLEEEVKGSGDWNCPAMQVFYYQLGQDKD